MSGFKLGVFRSREGTGIDVSVRDGVRVPFLEADVRVSATMFKRWSPFLLVPFTADGERGVWADTASRLPFERDSGGVTTLREVLISWR